MSHCCFTRMFPLTRTALLLAMLLPTLALAETFFEDDFERYVTGNAPAAPWTAVDTINISKNQQSPRGAQNDAQAARLRDLTGSDQPRMQVPLIIPPDQMEQGLTVQWDYCYINNTGSPQLTLQNGNMQALRIILTATGKTDVQIRQNNAFTMLKNVSLQARNWYRFFLTFKPNNRKFDTVELSIQNLSNPTAMKITTVNMAMTKPVTQFTAMRFDLNTVAKVHDGEYYIDNVSAHPANQHDAFTTEHKIQEDESVSAPHNAWEIFDRLPNGTFELGLGSWATADLYGSGIVTTRDDDATDGDGSSLRLQWEDPYATPWLDSPAMNLPTGHRLRLRFMLKAQPSLVGKQIRVQLTGPSWSGQSHDSIACVLTDQWQRYELIVPAVPSVVYPLRFRWRLPDEGTAWIDGVTLDDLTTGKNLNDHNPQMALAWTDDAHGIYNPGDKAGLILRVTGNQNQPTCKGWIEDDLGNRQTWSITSWQRQGNVSQTQLNLPTDTIGHRDLFLTVMDDNKTIQSQRIGYAVVHPVERGHDYFGVFSGDCASAAIEKTGIHNTRFGAHQAWHVVTGQGKYPVRPFAGVEKQLAEHHIKPIISIHGVPRPLLNIPTSVHGRWQRLFGMQWEHDEKLRQNWKEYVYQLGKAYNANTYGFEAWNETNAGSFFLGSTKTVAQMLQVTRQALNQAGVDKPFLGPCTSHLPLNYIRRVYEQGGIKAVDGVTIHPYRTGVGRPEDTGYIEELDQLRAIFKDMGKPDAKIWVTENGWVHSDLPNVPPVRGVAVQRTADQVANYIIRMFTIGLTRGLDKQLYFMWHDGIGTGNLEFLGLTRPDNMGSPKTSLMALNTLAYMLDRAEFSQIICEQMPIYAYRFTEDDQDIIVAWASQGQASVALSGIDDVQIADRFGRSLPTQQQLVLSEKPIFIHCPSNKNLTLDPLFEPTEQRQDLILNQAVTMTLQWLGDPKVLGNLTRIHCDNFDGLEPVTVKALKVEGSSIQLQVTAQAKRPTCNMLGLSLEIGGQTYHTALPVSVRSAPVASVPLVLGTSPADWSSSSATGLETLKHDGSAQVTFSVRGSEKLYNTHWSVLNLKPQHTDYSRYRWLCFDLQTTLPSDDLFLHVQLKAENGWKYTSYRQPDVLAHKSDWVSVRLPLDW